MMNKNRTSPGERARTQTRTRFSTMLAVGFCVCILFGSRASVSLAIEASSDVDCGDSSECRELQEQLYAALRQQDAFMHKYEALQKKHNALEGKHNALEGERNTLLGERDTLLAMTGNSSAVEAIDPGAAARCANVRAGTTPGTLEYPPEGALGCVPIQSQCNLREGWIKSNQKWKCQEYWSAGTCTNTNTSTWSNDECREKCSDASDCHSDCGSNCGAGCNCNGDAVVDAVDCPDGGIGWQGVLITAKRFNQHCAAWDSVTARLGLMQCSKNMKTCTRMAAMHITRMSKSAGVLMMKRMRCTPANGCKVFKAGQCFDVGQDVFSDKHNERMMDTMGNETQEWASLVVAQLKANTTNECDTGDLNIAEAGILSF